MSRVSFWLVACVALFLGTDAALAQQTRRGQQAPAVTEPNRIKAPKLQATRPMDAKTLSAFATEEQPGLRTGGDPSPYWQRTGPANQGPTGAQTFGPPCVVDCTGATSEAEACGATSNDGCSVDACGPVGFETVTLGGSVCGNVFADDGIRDVDYYQLTLTATTNLSIDIQSELPVVMQLVEDPAGDCSDWFPLETVFSDDTCTHVNLSRTVVAGNYYVMVSVADPTTIFFAGFPCGGRTAYRFDVTGAATDCLAACPGTAEVEACGNDGNDGCNLLPTPAFEPYTLGTTVCGTSRTFVNATTMLNNRDIDWYEFTVTASGAGMGLSEVTVDVTSEFPSLFLVTEAICSGASIFLFENNTTVNCATNSSTLILPDGTYYFLIGPGDEFGGIFNGLECTDPSNEYQFTINAVDAMSTCQILPPCVGTTTTEICGPGNPSNFDCDPAIAETITVNTPHCSEIWATGGQADLEYYDFTIASVSDVTISITSQTPVFFFLQDQDCVNGPFLISTEPFNSADCIPAVQQIALAPGNYTLFGAPGVATANPLGFTQAFDGAPCGFNNELVFNIVATPPAPNCPIVCPPIGTVMENEVCGGEDNNWCIASVQPANPEPLTIGQGICGTLKADGTADFDFYSFTLAQATDIEIQLQANIPTRAVIKTATNFPICPAVAPFFDPDVPGTETFAAADCLSVTSGSVTLPAGDYVVFVRPADAVTGPIFGGFPCGTSNDYIMFVNLSGSTACDIVTGTCLPDCTTGDIVLDLTSPSALDSIDIDVTDADGVSVANATLPGPIAAASMFTQNFSGLPNGVYNIEITGNCPGGADPVVSVCAVALFIWNDPDSVIFTTEGLGGNTVVSFGNVFNGIEALPQAIGNRGCVDSTAALEAALLAAGESVLVIPGTVTLDNLPCITPQMGADDILWVVQGTFPHDGPILAAEGQVMADLLVAGVSVYQEGADVWAINPATPFFDYDGVNGNAAAGNVMIDGDDSFTAMVGDTLAPNLDTLVFGQLTYTQDNNNPAPFYLFGNDTIDQLELAAFIGDPLLDEAMPNGEAYAVWINFDDGIPDPLVAELQYATAIHHSTSDATWMGGRVLVQSFEFGGFPAADRNAIAAAYIDSLRPPTGGEIFKRGDCNGDGAANIADAVRILNVLFPQGCTPGVDCPSFECADACDANDDGTNNIADAVATLNVLFPQGCTPGVDCPAFPAPGDTTCGIDPTADMLPMCVFTACP